MNREGEVELTSLPLFALHPDPAAVRLDGELAECQSEPGASHAWRGWRLRLLELPKDDLVILLRNSRPVVGDGKQHAVRRGIVPRADTAAMADAAAAILGGEDRGKTMGLAARRRLHRPRPGHGYGPG